uniref:hypothetical protein n=1 Tax=Bordetella sputigena TaxID=1416810 RepID=UPI0039EFD176
MVDRIAPPLTPKAPKGMRAVVNETAFLAFCSLHSKPKPAKHDEILMAIDGQLSDSIAYVGRFSSASPLAAEDFDDECRKEAESLVLRLLQFFPGVETTTLRPRFSGCGLVSACEGDLIEGSCLYEIKAGDRAFRVGDLRQLLTYSALAYAKDNLTFKEIGLFNPRTGVAWRKSLEDVSHALSGLRLSDTLSALVEQFSGASASR